MLVRVTPLRISEIDPTLIDSIDPNPSYPARSESDNNIIYSVLTYSHLRNINNLFEIILLKYNVIDFFMIFKIMGHVYDTNIQSATAFLSDRKATPECLFERGLCFNYCENRARHPVSTTFFCKNNRLNIVINILTLYDY